MVRRPAGLLLPKRVSGDGCAAELAGVPGFKNCGHMVLGPADGQWPAVFENQNDGLAGGYDCLEELFLVSRQVEIRTIVAFAGDADLLTEAENDHVGVLGDRYRSRDAASRIEADGRLGDHCANTLEHGDALAVVLDFVVRITRRICVGADTAMCWMDFESGSRWFSFLSSVIDSRADSRETARWAGEREPLHLVWDRRKDGRRGRERT